MHYKRAQREKAKPIEKPERPIPKKGNNRSQAFLIDRNSLYTMGELAKLFKMSNRTLSDAAKEVRAKGEMYGKLAYDLPEVARAVWGYTITDEDGDDPYAGMKPSERKAQIESQIKYVELQAVLARYTTTDDSHTYIAEKFKVLDLQLSTLPDEVERQVGITPEQLSIIDKCVDKMRRSLMA